MKNAKIQAKLDEVKKHIPETVCVDKDLEELEFKTQGKFGLISEEIDIERTKIEQQIHNLKNTNKFFKTIGWKIDTKAAHTDVEEIKAELDKFCYFTHLTELYQKVVPPVA
jgi:hypothetical protein